ncbi:hypothetical protein [Kitasatospora viridis]|uniref:Leucine rich repeat (LRR) protein n=1 Tax=Kitasatospora viridis TaxID=281105 RepID=A0A561UBD5_9ACTN|nr:hypothetical protein [Kitasatospora viridis]TWF96668.1 hypothetical protein FHX73_11440 [Kitasatospora viridis]
MPSVPVESWLRGVAANPAAPSDVLLRLLTPQGKPAWKALCRERALPADLVEAVLAHPERAVRQAFARNRFAEPAQRGRLVNDPDAFVRASLAGGPSPRLGRGTPLPDDVLETLLTAPDQPGLLTANEIAQELSFSSQIPAAFRHRALTHPNPGLRRWASTLWTWLTPEQRARLRTDPAQEVRDEARRQDQYLDPGAMAAQLPEEDGRDRQFRLHAYAISQDVADQCLAQRRGLTPLALNRFTPAGTVAALATDPDTGVRALIAARADLTEHQFAALAADSDEFVRTRTLAQPLPRTWPQCAAVTRVIGHTADCVGPVRDLVIEPEPAWYTACATSTNPTLRRVAATCGELPEELVERLADDPDPEVRHLLALNHPSAPGRIVLDAFLACPDQRHYLLTRANLPRTGLRSLLTHQDPEVRALAAADPTLPAAPVQLLDAATPEVVRQAAARNPLLPLDLLDGLLDDPELAEAAAANPALTTDRLHALLDRALAGV